MNIKTIIKVVKFGYMAVTVIPPVIDGAKVIVNIAGKAIKNGLDKSECVKEIKKDFKLRREGVQTVKYEEV